MNWPAIDAALARVVDALDDAEYNFRDDRLLAAANRGYYAIFYCLTALLTTENIFAKTTRAPTTSSTSFSSRQTYSLPPFRRG